MDLFDAGMLSRGVYIIEGGTSFLSTAHTDDDLDRVIEAAVQTVRELRDGGFWRESSSSVKAPLARTTDFSIAFFGAYADDEEGAYDLVFDASRRADALGFSALWFPERHFHAFGGLS